MDYKEQQTQEIEALQAIYQEEELEVTCNQYPNISLRVNLKSNQENECACDFDVALVMQLPETYPDVIPRISLEGLDDIFTDDRVQQAVHKLEEEASNNLGMVMVFSIVSALQDEIGVLLEEKKKELEKKVEEEKEKAEAVLRKKFEGTPVTPDSFRAWKEKFDKERKALVEKKEKEREAALAGKLTGRQLFLRDATLNLSDVALIEQSVEIDESLFDEEIDGLDIDSDED
ncbi:hypothetical protein V3C99_004073 [Haemonchus contortus]|uniref:RWD domain-containing protein n=2 Tax=Haemonchus TaxID=6288 RepID=A0A158QQZ2_HAEPC|nr:RWD domain containing protein [Haemonchus contortus]VDO59246.1 unnamed protein product [Haemonchus placei]